MWRIGYKPPVQHLTRSRGKIKRSNPFADGRYEGTVLSGKKKKKRKEEDAPTPDEGSCARADTSSAWFSSAREKMKKENEKN